MSGRGKSRFDALRERAAALDMVVGVYLVHLRDLPAEGAVGTLQARRIGAPDRPLDEHLDTIDRELAYWAKRASR